MKVGKNSYLKVAAEKVAFLFIALSAQTNILPALKSNSFRNHRKKIISKIQGYGNLRLYVSLSIFEEFADEMEVTFPFNRAKRNRELSRENEIETEIIQDDGNHDASFCCSRVCNCETIVIGRSRKPD